MCTLSPCSEDEKNRSLFLSALTSLDLINWISHWLHCWSLSLYSASKCVSIYCPVLCGITPSAPLIVPASVLFLSLTLLTAGCLWRSSLLWLAGCVWQVKGLQAKLALMNTQPHHLNGLPPAQWAGSWLAVLWANERQPLTGAGGCDTRGCLRF